MLQKYSGNYAVANGLPNRIPNKGHLNFVLHDMQRMVVQQKKTTTTVIMKRNILFAAMFS
jgi:argonaute-like protein implicated in RNA metabolism and viral defense